MNITRNLEKYNQTRILKLLENASSHSAKTLLTDLEKLNGFLSVELTISY